MNVSGSPSDSESPADAKLDGLFRQPHGFLAALPATVTARAQEHNAD